MSTVTVANPVAVDVLTGVPSGLVGVLPIISPVAGSITGATTCKLSNLPVNTTKPATAGVAPAGKIADVYITARWFHGSHVSSLHSSNDC